MFSSHSQLLGVFPHFFVCPKSLFSPFSFREASARPVLDVRAHVLELGENLCEVGGLGVDAQHVRGEAVHDGDAAVPEPVLVALHQEGLQRVADLVAHVAAEREKRKLREKSCFTSSLFLHHL